MRIMSLQITAFILLVVPILLYLFFRLPRVMYAFYENVYMNGVLAVLAGHAVIYATFAVVYAIVRLVLSDIERTSVRR